MTTVRRSAALIVAASLVTACSSQTVIRSNPSGAKVFLDGTYAGTTPYTLSDKKIVGSSTSVRLEYPGLQPSTITLSKNEELQVGALIGGLFLLVPFLWVMGYKGEHTVELRVPDPQNGFATAARGRAIELQQVDQATP
ncbi:MAG: PEGA domain-containing protein [Kofleriaceae bacterium]